MEGTLFGSRSPRSDMLLTVRTLVSDHFFIRLVVTVMNMSYHKDLDPINLPSVGFNILGF